MRTRLSVGNTIMVQPSKWGTLRTGGISAFSIFEKARNTAWRMFEVFTHYFSLDDRRLKQFSSNDNLISEDFTPSENGYLLITRRLAENPSKLIQGGLGAASKLPNLNYGASALESNTPIAFPKLKMSTQSKKSGRRFQHTDWSSQRSWFWKYW